MSGAKLFVGGIPTPSASVEQVTELFNQQGVTPFEVVVLPPKGSNPESRCGFVRVPEDSADFIITVLDGMLFEGFSAPLNVRLADNQGPAKKADAPHAAGTFVSPPDWPTPPGSAALPLNNGGLEGVDAEAMRQQAKAAGRWLDAAEWKEELHRQAGEAPEARFHRLSLSLHAAAVSEHYIEAAALLEQMEKIDPKGAALANATAAAAAAAVGSHTTQATSREPPPTSWPVPPPPPAVVPPSAVTWGAAQAEYHGAILTFSPEKRYGFVQCPDLGCDVFLSDKQIGNFQVGDYVAFDVYYNPKGKPQAQNLRPYMGDATAGNDAPYAKRARA